MTLCHFSIVNVWFETFKNEPTLKSLIAIFNCLKKFMLNIGGDGKQGEPFGTVHDNLKIGDDRTVIAMISNYEMDFVERDWVATTHSIQEEQLMKSYIFVYS